MYSFKSTVILFLAPAAIDCAQLLQSFASTALVVRVVGERSGSS